ncbi:MAG: DUF2271 domain-containing protein [Polyangiaceae bacterium]
MGGAKAYVAALFLVGCTVTDGDSEFWSPSQDLGGAAAGGVAGQTAAGGVAGSAPSGGGAGGVPSGGGAAGTPGAGGAPAGGAGGGTATGCALHFEFGTVTYHGKYSPKNIGAVWIADGSGKFIKSLNVWAAKRISNLLKWNAASAGNKVDAITAATASSHGAHAADWDCTDVNHSVVPDGPYKLMLEFTEEDSAKIIWPPGPSTGIDFVKGSGPVSLNPPDLANYVSMKLTLN